MSILTASIQKNIYTIPDHYYSLRVSHFGEKTEILMALAIPFVNTCDLPETYNILSKRLPSILYALCFNPNNFSFQEEVKATEVGHLFEHILLEYLSQEKTLLGYTDPVYKGETEWDWNFNPQGTFNITIDAGLDDRIVFVRALKKSMALLNRIVASEKSFN